MQIDPLKELPIDLLSKLASIVAHVDELRSIHGNEQFDGAAIDSLLMDEQVKSWVEAMREMALAPMPRNKT